MESLALLATIVVAPAFFGGPIALALTYWRLDKTSRSRAMLTAVLAALSIAVGIYLISKGISRGATNIGVLGVVTGAGALFRLRKRYGSSRGVQ